MVNDVVGKTLGTIPDAVHVKHPFSNQAPWIALLHELTEEEPHCQSAPVLEQSHLGTHSNRGNSGFSPSREWTVRVLESDVQIETAGGFHQPVEWGSADPYTGVSVAGKPDTWALPEASEQSYQLSPAGG